MTTFPCSVCRFGAALVALGLVSLSSSLLPAAFGAEVAAKNVPSSEAVLMSPFEVDASSQKGYYSPNTMAGTRLNSKIEDLASSITVVTKEQMADFALLDINDIFLYEASTEGTGNFTDFSFDRNGYPMDNTQLEPNSANRMRGVSSANTAVGNFETSGRVPIDPTNIDAVEISRGPNANIFGLGKAGGTVNVIPASANLQRNRSEAGFRADTYGGYRTSLDLNRVLVPGKLAVRGSGAYQRDAFIRKPSGTHSLLLNGMAKYQPFRSTTMFASFSSYHIQGNRANTTMPRDTVTAWKEAGSPTWNPITQRISINGVPSANTFAPTPAGLPPYFIRTGGGGQANSNLAVQPDGSVGYWGPSHASADLANPAAGVGQVQLLNTNAPILADQTLFAGDPSVTDKGIYDWTQHNLAAMNWLKESTDTTNFALEHFFLNGPRHVLALQAGYFKEASKKYRRDLAGGSTSQRPVGALYIDANEFLPDGRANPDLGRPFIGLWSPNTFREPLSRETYRAQAAYRIDLREEKTWWRWFGMHQLSGYYENKEDIRRSLNYEESILSDHSWITWPAGTLRAQPASTLTNNYFRFYVGDNKGANVDYAPGSLKPGTYPYTYGSPTGQKVTEQATIGLGLSVAGGGTGANNRRQILKTQGAVLQSHLWKDRIVTTVGYREDKSYNRQGAPVIALPDGRNIDMDSFYSWASGDWRVNQGRTKTAGVVLKPLTWLNLHSNVSNSFLPQPAAVNLQLEPVPDPSGKGKDYGFSLNLLQGKLVLRFNQFEMNQINSRASESRTLATRLRDLDFSPGSPVALVPMATRWVTRAHPTWTNAQIITEVSRITELDEKFISSLPDNLTETGDVKSKGKEIEIFYNPSPYWTMKLNVTENETIEARVAPGITNWLAARMPVWEKMIDPELNVPWFTTTAYDPQSPFLRLNSLVLAPLKIAQAVEGKSRPQIRKYRVNMLTSYQLAGLTDNPALKPFKVGGGLRWEDRGAIGYWGVEEYPAIITALDANRPIYDKAHLYVDAFVSYRTRLFANKAGATFQLNVRNLHESGRLQPIAAYPNGKFNGYRIIDPRQFILSATFDL